MRSTSLATSPSVSPSLRASHPHVGLLISAMQFGQPFGMMHAGGDVEDIFHAIHASLHYSSHVGLWADIRTLINGVRAIFGYTLPTFNLFAYAGRHLAARRAAPPDDERADFAAKLIAAHKAGKVEEIDVFTTVLANIAAGSDTTAISLSAIVWHLERHPQAKAKLRAEIADMAAKGQVSDPVTFAEAQHMPYLQAVIKETLRMHPAVGMMLPRVVPPEGARLAGWWFPGGVRTLSVPPQTLCKVWRLRRWWLIVLGRASSVQTPGSSIATRGSLAPTPTRSGPSAGWAARRKSHRWSGIPSRYVITLLQSAACMEHCLERAIPTRTGQIGPC